MGAQACQRLQRRFQGLTIRDGGQRVRPRLLKPHGGVGCGDPFGRERNKLGALVVRIGLKRDKPGDCQFVHDPLNRLARQAHRVRDMRDGPRVLRHRANHLPARTRQIDPRDQRIPRRDQPPV